MTQVFNTHKFLYSLQHEGNIKGHKVLFETKEGTSKEIELESIDIGTSPISCKLYDNSGNRYIVAFIRIKKIFFKGELVWDGSLENQEASKVKVIKGYK